MNHCAVNESGTVTARVEHGALRLYDAKGKNRHVDEIELSPLSSLCFAGKSLLIADFDKMNIVEYSAAGHQLRVIDLTHYSPPFGIAYSHGVIAVSLYFDSKILMLDYTSGAALTLIESKWLDAPVGLRFTADGKRIVVADEMGHCVTTFDVVSGLFVSVAADLLRNAIFSPWDVLVEKNGDGIVVLCKGDAIMASSYGMLKLVYVNGRGETQRVVTTPGTKGSLAWLGGDVYCFSDEGPVIIGDNNK
jgi:hypothetical protein